jgi:ethanolamine ammonia-lyase small subunit
MKGSSRTTGLTLSTNTVGLRAFTPARVGLGRTGVSQQIRDVLEFQRAHARARDAVHAHLNAAAVQAAIASVGANTRAPVIRLRSAATDRAIYLQRPDLGRILDDDSRRILAGLESASCDLAVIVADGLSALAVERHAPSLLAEFVPHLAGWTMAPVCIVEQGRVAIGDEIGFILHAQLSVVLIGERPGLSSPDSLGAYITWHPRPGRTDAGRNCISNIRAEGLSYGEAAKQLVNCMITARTRRLTGTFLGEAKSILPDQSSIGGQP